MKPVARIPHTDVERYVPRDSVYYCPSGIPDIGAPNRWAKTNRITEILFLSILIESKGVIVLLEACKILKTKKLPFSCSFIGGEGDTSAADFEKLVISLALGSRVRYCGKKYGADKEEAYSKADIFALPNQLPLTNASHW